MTKKKGLIWFKNDLRIHDNELLNASNICEEVLPIFIIDPSWANSSIHGFKKTGNFRLRFIYESVLALQQQLNKIGSELYFFVGSPEKIIPQLIIKHRITDIFTKKEFGPDELKVETKINSLGNMFRTTYHKLNTSSCLPIEELSTVTDDTFDVFYQKIISNKLFRSTHPGINQLTTIKLEDNKDIGVFSQFMTINDIEQNDFPFKGGEEEALERLRNYIWKTSNVNAQTEVKNFNNNSTAKFSPFISQGCLSVALVIKEVLAYEASNGKNSGTQALIKDILWREYYFAMFLKYGTKFFRQGGIPNKDMICLANYEALNKWIEGNTGEPIIDASMNEMAATGFLNGSGRKLVANYLSKKLLVDWRLGAAYFESQLIDYEVCLNYGNWASAIGVGPDNRVDEKYNVAEMAEKLDADGSYRKKWLHSA
jgi:deoxyribodipyrimidine photo-lyase